MMFSIRHCLAAAAAVTLCHGASALIVVDVELDPAVFTEGLLGDDASPPILSGTAFRSYRYDQTVDLIAGEEYEFNISFAGDQALTVLNSETDASAEFAALSFFRFGVPSLPGGVTGTTSFSGASGDLSGPLASTLDLRALAGDVLLIDAIGSNTDSVFSFTGAQFNFTLANDFERYTADFNTFVVYGGGFEIGAVSVPAPSGIALLALGLLALGAGRRDRPI